MVKTAKYRPAPIINQAAKKIIKTEKSIDKDKELFEKEWQRWGVKKKISH